MRWRTRVNFQVAVVVGVLLLLGELFFGILGGTQICPECGRVRYVWYWSVPLRPDIGLFKTYGCWHSPAALNAALEECGLQKSHAHQWLLIHAGGSGICALGKGRYIYNAENLPSVANLVRAASYHGDRELLGTVLKVLRDPENCHLVTSLAAGIGSEQINDVRRFHQYLDDHESSLDLVRGAAVGAP